MAQGYIWLGFIAAGGVLAPAALAGPAADPPAAPVSTAMLAPPPDSSFAFCLAHGGNCDRVPRATAMPDGQPTLTPVAWRDFCRRNKQDPACAR